MRVLQDLKSDREGDDLEGRLVAVEEEFRLTVETALESHLREQDIERILRGHRLEDFKDA